MTTEIDISEVLDASSNAAAELRDLPTDVVHLWQRPLEASISTVESCYGLLSKEERQRALRFRVERPRRDFILTRGTLRSLIGKYLHRMPASIKFRYSEFGKPVLDEPTTLRFNVSHTDGVALMAFVRGLEIGVDVERIRLASDFKGLAARFFSQLECDNLSRLTTDELGAAFFRCWTRKEAYIKAKGEGLSLPLGQFDVSIEPNENRALIATRPDVSETNRWMLCDVAFDPRYAAAVAVGTGPAAGEASFKTQALRV